MQLAQRQQPLTTQTHQTLPLPQAQLFVTAVAIEKNLQAFLAGGIERNWAVAKLEAQKRCKRVTTPLQVAKSAISLQLQALLQGQQPSMQTAL